MEDKIIVECFIPTLNQKFDVVTSENKTVYEFINLLSKSISELSGGLFINDKDNILCNKISGKLYNINYTLKEQGIINGSLLMLI